MRCLAIDTSGPAAGVAILEGDRVLGEGQLAAGMHHARGLLPLVGFFCEGIGTAVGEIDLFATVIGPGSFTGLRIGAGSVKGLALATGKPVVCVSSLEAIAMTVPAAPRVCPMLDAQRDEVYAALFAVHEEGGPDILVPEQVTDVESFLRVVTGEILFVGAGAERRRERIRTFFGEAARIVPAHRRGSTAIAAGLLGIRKFIRGGLCDTIAFAPRYLRAPEAERKVAAPEGSVTADSDPGVTAGMKR